jgi:hypothetical protein
MVRRHRGACHAALIAGAALACIPGLARAEDGDGSGDFSGTSLASRPVDGPSTTRVDLDDPWAGDDDVAGRLDAVPSVAVRRSGGSGQSAWVSVRGAAPVHTRVLLDGVPLHGAADTSFDLAALPLDLLDRIDVYRGYVPIAMMGAAAGGVVDLRTATPDGPGVIATVGGGTLGGRSASVAASGETGAHQLLGVIAMDGAEGDFVYRDDNGTPLEPRDDVERARRQNNEHNAVAALARHRFGGGGWRADTVLVGAFRQAGAPGTIATSAADASQQQWRLHLATRARRTRLLDDRLDLEFGASASVRELALRDPSGELFTGLPGEYSDRVSMVGATLQPTFWPAGPVRLHLAFDGTDETYSPSSSSGRIAAGRTTLGVGAELVARSTIGLEAALQGRTEVLVERGDNERDDQLLVMPAARLGWGADVGENGTFDVSATGEVAARNPGFAELYGAGDLIVGDPALRPESRAGAELGVRGGLTTEAVSLSGELAGWARSIDDLIVFYDNGSGVARPRNLDRGDLRGVELATAVAWHEWLSLTTTLSLLDARDGATGDRLPWRPPWSFDATLGGGYRQVRAQWQTQAAAGFSIDEAGLSGRPARVTHDVRAAWVPCFEPRLRLAVQLDNVFNLREGSVDYFDGGTAVSVDKPVYDVLGYPLPGRTFFVSLSFNSGSFE